MTKNWLEKFNTIVAITLTQLYLLRGTGIQIEEDCFIVKDVQIIDCVVATKYCTWLK